MRSEANADAIRLEANLLGGQFRMVCPECGGGTTHERSLSVLTNERGQVSWRCFRAQCGAFGGNLEVTSTIGAAPRPFRYPTESLNSDMIAYFWDQFELTLPPGVKYCHELRRVVFPVRSPSTRLRGHIARSFAGAEPKVLTYRSDVEAPFLHWTGSNPSQSDIVIVEDWISAEKAVKVPALRAVSLQGTYISDEAFEEIITIAKGRQIHLALDADAYQKALKYASTLGRRIPKGVKVWKLVKDLKYETVERIGQVLDGRVFNFSGDDAVAGVL